MLTAFVFDEEQSEQVEDWEAALERLDRGQLLWVAARDPTEDDVASLRETLELGDEIVRRLRERPSRASVVDHGERMHMTLFAVSGDGDAPTIGPVECVLGPNWILTVHRKKVEVFDEFLARAEGEGKSGGSTHRRSSRRSSSGSSPATSERSKPSSASWRSWTRES